MKVTYKADATIAEVGISVDGIGKQLFTRGETYDLTDAFGEVVLTNPNFVDASGKNPNFTCSLCGGETFDTGHLTVNGVQTLRGDDGKLRHLVCPTLAPPDVAPVAKPTPYIAASVVSVPVTASNALVSANPTATT